MSKFLVLKKRRDFLRAAKNITMVSKNVMIQAAPSLYSDIDDNKKARVGFTATKRLGKAHIRNKTKRRLRAVMREVYDEYTLNMIDYVLVGRYNTFSCSFEDLKKDIIWALKKTNKILLRDKADNEENSNING